MTGIGWLSLCAALAAGEFLASWVPQCAEAWPAAAIAAALTACFGYGACVRGWRYAFFFFAGLALFLQASVAGERAFRDRPWMRTAKSQWRAAQEPETAAVRVRKALSRRIGLGLDHDREAAALNRAILLGERSKLPWRTKRTFVESGTMHVFAISGLHVMVVLGVIRILLLPLLMPRRWAGVLSLPFLWGYVVVIGGAPSAVRAATMASFAAFAPVFWRRPNGVVAWSLTFLLVHVADPLQIANVGSALSFAVMLAILLAVELTRDEPSGWRRKALVALAAWAAGTPIAAHVFGRVTPGGLVANLILIPVAEKMVAVGAFGCVLSFVSEKLAAHVNNLAALLTSLMVGIAEVVSRFPGGNVEVTWSIGTCAAWYVALALAAWLYHSVRRRRRSVLSPLTRRAEK